MSWRSILSTPSPSTAVVLEAGRALALRHERRGTAHAAAPLPPRTLEVGRVGLQSVDREQLEPVLARLAGEVGGGRRPIVVLPTGFLRTHLLDFEAMPRKQAQLEEVVRWRLKKLLPVPPTDLRLDLVPLAPGNGRKRLLCVTGLERALRELEAAFTAAGMEPAIVTGRLFALAEAVGRPGRATVLVQQEPGFLAVAVLTDGEPVVLRTKPVPEHADAGGVAVRELGVVLAYVRGALALDGPMDLCVSAQDGGLAAALARWAAEQEGLEEVAAPSPVGIGEEHRAALAPAWALLAGGGA